MSGKGILHRRGFLKSLTLAGTALAFLPRSGFGLSLDSLGKKAGGPAAAGRLIHLNLKDGKYSALAKPGSAVYVEAEGEKNPIILSRIAGGKVVALSSACTHKGCRLKLPKKGKIVCPCHGSVFTENGKVVRGPAQTDLKAFRAEIVEDMVTISMP